MAQGLLKSHNESQWIHQLPTYTSVSNLSKATGRGFPTSLATKRRKFLEEALASMQQGDPVKAMLADIKVIVEETDVEKQEEALDNLNDYCEDIDLAKDFDTIGGYNLLDQLLRSNHDGLRWRGAGLIATLVQNNPHWQHRVTELKILPTLLTILDTDSCVNVRIKSLSAISCSTRDSKEAQDLFLQYDGFSAVLRAMQAEEEKLQIKAAFMIRAMVLSDSRFKDTLCNIGMVEQFVGLLQREHNNSHEHIMGALLAIASGNHAQSIAECQRADIGLEKLLRERINLLNGKPEYNEELTYAQDLLKVCFTETPTTVDR